MREGRIIFAEELTGPIDMEYDVKLADYEALRKSRSLRTHLGLFSEKDIIMYLEDIYGKN